MAPCSLQLFSTRAFLFKVFPFPRDKLFDFNETFALFWHCFKSTDYLIVESPPTPSEHFYFNNNTAVNTSFIITLPRRWRHIPFDGCVCFRPNAKPYYTVHSTRDNHAGAVLVVKSFFLMNYFGCNTITMWFLKLTIVTASHLEWKQVWVYAKFACFEQLSFRLSMKKVFIDVNRRSFYELRNFFLSQKFPQARNFKLTKS